MSVEVTSVIADKRSIDVRLKVNGFEYEVYHDHWIDRYPMPQTKIEAIGHERHCEMVSDEHHKYFFRGVFDIDGTNVQIHRTYDEGCLVSVNGGKPELVVAEIDGQEWKEVDGVVMEVANYE